MDALKDLITYRAEANLKTLSGKTIQMKINEKELYFNKECPFFFNLSPKDPKAIVIQSVNALGKDKNGPYMDNVYNLRSQESYLISEKTGAILAEGIFASIISS